MVNKEDEVITRLRPPVVRRYFAITIVFVLGAILINIAFMNPPEDLGWQIFLIVFGLVVIWLADAMRRSTALWLELTDKELRDSSGRVLCRVEDMQSVERGTFAFKPSNGFLLNTKTAQPRAWAPGLWWRVGKRIGVGGVASASESKFMADVIALKLSGQSFPE